MGITLQRQDLWKEKVEVISSEEKRELKFKGTQVAYAVVCHRKLWLFSKGITLENTSDRVKLGKAIDRQSFGRKTEFSDENISIDFITTKDGVIIHEVKLSDSLEKAHIMQTKYYIFYLRQLGIKANRGVIHYPKQKKIKNIIFKNEDEKLIKDIIGIIESVLAQESPPAVINAPYCRKCAYYYFCYG